MSGPPVTVSPDTDLATAAKKMRDENVGFLPVCDESKKVVGTLTDRDLAIRVVAGSLTSQVPVRDVMTREAVTCRADDDLKTAQTVMGERKKSRIICVDEKGDLCGVISLSDLGKYDQSSRTARTMRKVTSREAHA
jgi:CBS domain-containing protein